MIRSGQIWNYVSEGEEIYKVKIITTDEAKSLGYGSKSGEVKYLYLTGPIGKVGSFQHEVNFLKLYSLEQDTQLVSIGP